MIILLNHSGALIDGPSLAKCYGVILLYRHQEYADFGSPHPIDLRRCFYNFCATVKSKRQNGCSQWRAYNDTQVRIV